MPVYHGFLFSKRHLIGSRSEGPTYYLQLDDYSEIVLRSECELWQEDPRFQPLLGKLVIVEGDAVELAVKVTAITVDERDPTKREDGEDEPADFTFELVSEMVEVTVETVDGVPTVKAEGKASSTGWTEPHLAARLYLIPPQDGIQEYEFFASRPAGPVIEVMTPIFASEPLLDQEWMIGVRVIAKQNNKEYLFPVVL